MNRQLEQRKFRSDALKMKRLRVAAGLTVKEFIERSDLDRGTVGKILRGDPVFLHSLTQAAEAVFGITDVTEILHPEELASMGVQTDLAGEGDVLEWRIESYESGWQETSNGLQYQLVKSRHRFLTDRYARGKCYELRHMSDEQRRRVETYLYRHVQVCDEIGQHPNVAQNITAAFVGGLWWVMDRWEDGESLEHRLAEGPLGEYALKVVMSGIAEGLSALHRAGIVRRELTPKSILLRDCDDRPILTDLELAKLEIGQPSVSPDEWPDDPYRALEVSCDVPVDARADIYSWARVFVHAATGSLPDRGMEDMNIVELPCCVKDWVVDSLSIAPSSRPNEFKGILKSLKAWP